MIGLARMTMHLAESRASVDDWGLIGFWTTHKIEPCDRGQVDPDMHPVSAEYYQIIDRISRGERP